MQTIEIVVLVIVIAAIGFAVFKAKSGKVTPTAGAGGSAGNKPPVEQK